jgi:hypothetical protein
MIEYLKEESRVLREQLGGGKELRRITMAQPAAVNRWT